MTDACGCPPEAGSAVCELPAQGIQRPAHVANACPECGRPGKPVQRQSVKAMLAVSLREVRNVFVCCCFRHTVGDIRVPSSQSRAAIVDNINTGINAGQCACDLRNPQGSCCLGNVRSLAKRFERPASERVH